MLHMKKLLQIIIISFLFSTGNFLHANNQTDSLKNLLSKVTGSDKAALLNTLAEKYWKIETNASYNYTKEAIQIAEGTGDSLNLAEALHNLGRYHFVVGEPEEALECYFKSLAISEKISYTKGIGKSYNSIGLAYWSRKEFDIAIEYIANSQEYFIQINDLDLLASAINNLGVIYGEREDFEKSLSYFIESYKIVKQLKNNQKIVVRLSNIGYVYEMMNDYPKALLYYNYSLRLADSLHSGYDKANVMINIGSVNQKLKNYEKAIQILKEALEISRDINAKLLAQESLRQLYSLYNNLGNTKKALEYHVLYTNIKDSIINEKKNEQIINIHAKYENEKKEDEIKLLHKANEISKLEKKKQKNFAYFIIALIVLISVVLLFVFIAYYTKRKINTLLAKRNREITKQNIEIQKQAENLQQTNDELKKLSVVASKTNNAVIIMDTNYDIEWINPGFTNMFGFTLEQLINERGKNLLEISGNPDIYQKLKKVLFEKKTVIYEAQNEKRNGEKIWTQTTVTPVVAPDGNVSKIIAIDSDISKLKKAEKEIIHQRNEIELQKNEITDSIIYSKRIQNAILTSKENIHHIIPESFTIYLPKEIIGGDFYWMRKINGNLIIAVVDCTGHGVPGALMSMLGITLLNEIVEKKGIIIPGEILNELRSEIIRVLHQTDEAGSNDGMDIAICSINPNKKILKYAGANNPLLIANQKRILELKPDKMPVSLCYKKTKLFFTQEVELSTGDMIYMYTDGFVDQFGGKEGKKFFKRNLFKLIKEISAKDPHDQKIVFESTFYSWKSDEPQLDDVTLVGFRVPVS